MHYIYIYIFYKCDVWFTSPAYKSLLLSKKNLNQGEMSGSKCVCVCISRLGKLTVHGWTLYMVMESQLSMCTSTSRRQQSHHVLWGTTVFWCHALLPCKVQLPFPPMFPVSCRKSFVYLSVSSGHM